MGRFAKTDGDEVGGEGPVVISETGNFVVLSTDSLQELQTGIWGASAWKEMSEVAVFTTNKADTAAHGLKFKPLSVEARAIADRHPALYQPQEDGAAATDLGGYLEEDVQAGGGGAGHPCRAGGRCQAFSVLRHPAHDGRGRPSWRHDQQGGR